MPAPEGSILFQLLKTKQWEEAKVEAKKSTLTLRKACKVDCFYDNKTAANVHAMHVACANQAPPDVIQTLHDIYPHAVTMPDSAYQRLPLHVAVIFNAPPKTVSLLLNLNGRAARVQDLLGRLPIHYAVKDPVSGERSTRLLLKANPDSCRAADDQGLLPVHVACLCGMSMTMVRMFIRAAPETILAKSNDGSTPAECAKLQLGPNQAIIVDLLERCQEETIRIVEEYGLPDSSHSSFNSSTGSYASSFQLNGSIQKGSTRAAVPYHVSLSGDISVNSDIPDVTSISGESL